MLGPLAQCCAQCLCPGRSDAGLALEIVPVRAAGGGPGGAWVAPVLLPEQLDAIARRNEDALRRAMGLVDGGARDTGSRTLAELHADITGNADRRET